MYKRIVSMADGVARRSKVPVLLVH